MLIRFVFMLLSARAAWALSPSCATMKCHSDLSKGASVHGPVKAKGCDVCHDVTPANRAHPQVQSPRGSEANKTCLLCHDQIQHTMAAKDSIIHSPVKRDGCVSCHDPHHSPNKALLKEPARELCLSCHQSIHDGAVRSANTHPPVTENKQCLNCHQAHASTKPGLLRGDQKSLCLSCHKDIARLLSERQVVHKPIAQGECTACHQPHGSAERKLLTESYSEKFYVKYDPSQFQLCLRCHDVMGKTSFRNAGINLHSLHLKQDKKGRSCRACHEVHASHSAHLVRDEMPYLGVSVPLRFSPRPQGGTCTTACHKERSYNRERGVKNDSGR